MSATQVRARTTCQQIFATALDQGFLGFDPYDALNAELPNRLGLYRTRLGRLVFTQAFKRLPIDLRNQFGVAKSVNPKALALFLAGCLDLGGGLLEEHGHTLAERLLSSRSSHYPNSCWGYPFAWQSRAFYLPSGTPTIVATAYAAHALYRAHGVLGTDTYLAAARSACDFILQDLNRTETPDGICFSYSPLDHTQVHNASVLGARLLCVVGTTTGERELVDAGREAWRFCLSRQNPEGSWPYGEAGFQNWIDNFHTGFVLECLQDSLPALGRLEPESHLERGRSFYKNRMFENDGSPRYYSHSRYPLDVHCYAQAILTLCLESKDVSLESARKVIVHAYRDLWHPGGRFAYQKRRFYRNNVNYLRWSQAWMFRGLASYVKAVEGRRETLD